MSDSCVPAAPMLDALAAGLRECSRKPITGERLDFLDGFLNNMLRSRISRRVLAEQHLMLDVPRYSADAPHVSQLALYASQKLPIVVLLLGHRAGFVGAVCTALHVSTAVHYATERCRQVRNLLLCLRSNLLA